MQLVMGLVASETSPSGRLAGEELRQQMLQVLGMLKEKDREVLWMRHHDDLSFLEIAAVLSITDNAARAALCAGSRPAENVVGRFVGRLRKCDP